MTGPVRPALRLMPDEQDQVPRLARYRELHPRVEIREGLGYWQARIPEPNGESILTRYTLAELLDKLQRPEP